MRIERLETKLTGYIKTAPANGPSAIWFASGILLIAILGLVEYCTANKLRMVVLYLIPVALVTLRASKLHGYMLSVISAAAMEIAVVLGRKQSISPVVSCFNILLSSALFMTFVIFIQALRNIYDDKLKTSRLDGVTGLPNIRSFSELLAREIERCRRFKHPFSVACISCSGPYDDSTLRLMAECMRLTLRSTDIIARVNDDEFVMLLTETDNAAAGRAMEKLQSTLKEIITQYHTDLKFGIGIVSLAKCPYSCKEVIDMAEMAMQQACPSI